MCKILCILKTSIYLCTYSEASWRKSHTSTLISCNFDFYQKKPCIDIRKNCMSIHFWACKKTEMSKLFYKITKSKPQSSSCWHTQILEHCAQLHNIVSKLSNRAVCIHNLKATWWYHIEVWMKAFIFIDLLIGNMN